MKKKHKQNKRDLIRGRGSGTPVTIGRDPEPIFSKFMFTAEGEADYFNSMSILCLEERGRFHKRTQENGESVEAFFRNLYELAEHCEFGLAKDKQIHDRIVIGIADREVSLKLHLEADLTLEKAIQIARQSELVKKQTLEMRAESEVKQKKFRHFIKGPGAKWINERKGV